MLTNQAQQTGLAITSYLKNLLFITDNIYHKMLRLKAYSDTLNKHLWYLRLYQMEALLSPMLE